MHQWPERGAGIVGLGLWLAGVFVSPPSLEARSGSRLVECRIESAGTPVYSGMCRFNPAGGGSFVLEHRIEGRPLNGPILTVSVTVVSPNAAEVRGLTRAGINSRWGEARRSGSDRACWQGSDFRICAW
jgi:hypothetical protein